MSEENKNSPVIQVIVAVVITILVGSTAPWWYKEFFAPDSPETTDNPETPNLLLRQYLMDNRASRIIIVTPLGSNEYRIEEPSSQWPWEGTAKLDGGRLSGDAKFRNSLATMRVEGVVRSDDSIVIKYQFITDSEGNSAGGRVDEHIWYPSNY